MGDSNGYRLPYRVHTKSCSSGTTTTPPLLRRGGSCNGQRDQVIARQRGYSPSAPVRQRSRFCQLPGGWWWSKACDQSESPKQFCRVFPLQNGRDTHVKRPVKERRLYGQIGPQGRLLHSSFVDQSPKISEISVEGHNVGVCLPSFWLGQCPKSVHQNYETCYRHVAQNGSNINSLSGRHFDHGRKQTTCNSTCPISCQYTEKSRFCGELREISVDSIPTDGIPRFPSGFRNFNPSFTSRKSSQDTTGVPEGSYSTFPDTAKVGKLDRLAKQFHPSCLSSSSSLPPLTEFKESTTLPFNELCKRGAAISSSTRGTVMVERQLDGLERQGLGQWGPGPNDRDRCFPSGVGSGLIWSANRRSLDTVRKTTPHQLSRVDGRSLCSESLHSTQISSEGSFADGQSNSSDIYQQDGGHQVTHSVKSCIRTVDLVSSTSHQYYCKAYSRNPKHSGRPGVAYCSRPLQLETQTRDLSMHSESLGPYRNGSLCIPPFVPDPKVRKLETRPRGGNSGCLYPRLGSAGGVCLSPLCIGREMHKTSRSPESPEIGFSSPGIGNPTLVPITPPTLCTFPSVTSRTSRSVDQAGGKSSPNPSSISRVAYLNRSYSETGFSAEAQTLLMAAWRKNTSSAYSAAWQKWASWCNQHD